MKKPILTNWNNVANLKSLLLFAQLLDEMLYHQTIDSYKAPVLNTHSLCDEFINVSQEIQVGFLPSIAIKPIKAELAANLQDDDVAKEILGHNYEHIKNKLITDDKTENFVADIQIVKDILDKEYFNKLKDSLANLIINEPGERKKITKIARLFVTELLYKGYSEEYLHRVTQDFFFSKKSIHDTEQIKIFFSKFSDKPKKWKVVFKGTMDYDFLKGTSLLKKLSIKVGKRVTWKIGKKNKFEVKFIKEKSNEYPIYIICDTEDQMDPYSARRNVEYLLKFINNLVTCHDHKKSLDNDSSVLFEKALVYENNRYTTTTKNSLEPMEKIPQKNGDLKNDIEEMTNILDNMVSPSFYTIINSLNSHSCAVKSKTFENQLLSLWIGMETLLPPPAYKDQPIIENFTLSINPFLGREYIQKLMDDLHNSIKNCLSSDEYDRIFSTLPENNNEVEKIAMLISIREYDGILQDLCNQLITNELLPWRIFELTQKFRNSNEVLSTIKQHDQRIEWQLRRIYRTRNLITHKGRLTEYLPRLLENTHVYYHTVLNLITKNSVSKKDSIVTLNDIFALVKFEHQAHKKYLEKSRIDCNQDNFKILLFG
jgi:hypothetical protein